MRRHAKQLLSSHERASYGCIVTFVSEADGATLVLHRDGSLTDALRLACRAAVSYPGGPWRIQTVSSPESIYRDLQAVWPRSDAENQNRVRPRRYRTQPMGEGALASEYV